MDLAWKHQGAKRGPFRPLIFLYGHDRLYTWELPPAYDWVKVKDWEVDDIAVGRHTLPLSADLPTGSYSLGMVLLGQEGVLKAHRSHPLPALSQGEVRWPSAVHVVKRDRATQRITRALEAVRGAADEGRCHHASDRMNGLRWILPPEERSPYSHPPTRRALAHCWAKQAKENGADKSDLLLTKARHWDRNAPSVLNVAQGLAKQWVQEGEALLLSGDQTGAQALFVSALRADPRHPTLRKRIESIRDERLSQEAP